MTIFQSFRRRRFPRIIGGFLVLCIYFAHPQESCSFPPQRIPPPMSWQKMVFANSPPPNYPFLLLENNRYSWRDKTIINTSTVSPNEGSSRIGRSTACRRDFPGAFALSPYDCLSGSFSADMFYQSSRRLPPRSGVEIFPGSRSIWYYRNRQHQFNPSSGNLRLLLQTTSGYGKKEPFSASALPPSRSWYQRWWAYIFYSALLISFIFGIDRIQRRRVLHKERERTRIREIELFAKEAEARSQALLAENERQKNVELFSQIGKEITSSLDFETIFLCLYRHIRQLVDVSVFEIGIYHPQQQTLEFKFSIKQNKRIAPYRVVLKDKNHLAVWSILNRKPVFIGDMEKEYDKYLIRGQRIPTLGKTSRGDFITRYASVIYLPLIVQDRLLGVINIQSFEKDAYSEYHSNIL